MNKQAHSYNSHIHYSVDQFYFPFLEDLPVPLLLLHFTGVQMNKLPSSTPQRHFIHPGNKKNDAKPHFVCSESQETIPWGSQEEVRNRTIIKSPYPNAGLPPTGTRLHYSKFCCRPPFPRFFPLGWEGHFFPLLSLPLPASPQQQLNLLLAGGHCANRRLLERYPFDVRDFLAFKSHTEPGDCLHLRKMDRCMGCFAGVTKERRQEPGAGQ